MSCLNNDYFQCDPGNCLDSCDGMYNLNGSRVCMTGCPKGYYEGYNRLCVQCPHACDGCSGPSNTDCSSCRFARLGLSCVSKCPVGYVLDASAPATCIRPDECPGYVLNSSSCVDQCPSGFYPVDSAHPPYCERCNSLCKTCYGTGTDHCDACSKFRYDSNCVSVCPMVAPTIYNQDCLAECPSDNGCKTVCGDQFVWKTKCVKKCPASEAYSLNGICVTKCPKLHFEWKCMDVCPQGMLQFNDQCVKICPPGYFTDEVTCVKKCKHLSYGTSCRDACPGNLPHFNGKCVYHCPETLHFINPKNNECTSHCPYVVFQNQCLLHCPHNYFWSGQVCSFCDKMCNGCHGPGAKNCMTCRYVSNNGVCVRDCPDHTVNKTCVSKCPPGTFVAGQRKTCLASCPNDLPFSFHQECLASCPESSPYHEDGNQACLVECPRNTVHLQGKTLCQESCPDDMPMTANHLCVKECPPDRNFTYQKECLPKCPRATIFNEHKDICVSCGDNLFAYQNACYSRCPLGTRGTGIETQTGSEREECVPNDAYVFMWTAVVVFGLFVVVLYIIVCRPPRNSVQRNGQPLVQDEEDFNRAENNNDVIDMTDDAYHDAHDMDNDRTPILPYARQGRKRMSEANQTRQGISGINEQEEICHEDTICQPLPEERKWTNDGVDTDDLHHQSASTFSSADCTDVVHRTADVIVHDAPRLTAFPTGSGRPNPYNSMGSKTLCSNPEIEQNGGRSLIGWLSKNDTNAKPTSETSGWERQLNSLASNPTYAECTAGARPRIYLSESSLKPLSCDSPRFQSDKNDADVSILAMHDNTAVDETSPSPVGCTTNRRLICKGGMKGNPEGGSPISGNENNKKRFGQDPCRREKHVVEDIVGLVNTDPADPTSGSLQGINDGEETLLKHV
ncbi:proprotein convertase subtilisin/kexin type 5-like isoform X2 [Liolophura sinensis]|uniref:proprotein convertase subtilisin/kexin type 5-like isoform X2 n=1 Tax=Liolophura sinensis TaxID=3198878 RepID=UPI0031597E1C